MQALGRSGVRSYVMILFAPALGKPVSFSGLLIPDALTSWTNLRRQSFRAAAQSSPYQPYFAF
jgi:hypothetical protein